MEYFGRTARYHEPLTLAPGITAEYSDAGHILGSACILLQVEEDGRQRRILFSGDLGLDQRPILRDPDPPPEADIVVMETTYGDRVHKQLEPSIEEFYEVINTTLGRGGNVIIPTFALERAQEILFYLHAGRRENKLPDFLQVFLDSPMAISATEIFRRHPECYDDHTADLFARGHDPFRFSGLHFTRETADSMAINQIHSGAVIMAGSGMCTGGRIRHHLRQHLGRSHSSIVFVGYAAHGTLARRIVDGAREVSIFGDSYPVRASIHTIGGFSAHAGQAELQAWQRAAGDPEITFLVHGEKDSMAAFAGLLRHTRVEMPALHAAYEL
jgi:metallo-beta-lactamase family protein